MQPSDTAYPRFKSRLSPTELARFYTPTDTERAFCDAATRSPQTRLGFMLLLKSHQRLGYFVTSAQVPPAIIDHIAAALGEFGDREALRLYDASQARRKHLSAVRRFLGVRAFDEAGKALLRAAFQEAALVKDDVIDLINIGIETLVRHRHELPAFDTLAREARAQRVAANRALFERVHQALDEAERKALDQLFVVGDGPPRTSPWHELKRDATPPTREGLRELAARHEQLNRWGRFHDLRKSLPVVKVNQWALEGQSLDAASMADLAPTKRYAVALALIWRRQARVTDDLCDLFCKQMRRITHDAEAALARYLTDHQDKTDEILRRFAALETLLNSARPAEEQLEGVRQAVVARPDLCEFSRLHSEYGGKHECRFLWRFFKSRRAELLRILGLLRWVSTSQDGGFERSLAFMLGHRRSSRDWIKLEARPTTALTLEDLDWVPDKWWKLITGTARREAAPARLNRRQFEVCVCAQLVRELQSGDLCVVGSDAYSDYRDELLPMAECERTRADYGEKVGLPVEPAAFVRHLRTLLGEAATRVDEAYPENPYFRMVDGRPKLGRLTKKPLPEGFRALDEALTRKLDGLELSLLDVLTDTLHWLGWGEHFGPLSGHRGKLKEEDRRKILTAFAYGTGLGPTQVARNVADLGARQVAFVHQRQVTTEKLEAAIGAVINAYNRFQLPRHWGDTRRAAADGTQWNLYENNLLSERHIRYGGYGGIAYYHVSDAYVALFSHFIPCGVWEAVYLLDGLTKNRSDIQPDTIHGDTQAQSAPVYGLAFLLGIQLMPRIRNWKDLKWFRPSADGAYRNIDALFTAEAVDWDLIACHLPDLLQVAQSIRAGRLQPSTLLRKLGTASRKNKLYYAFRELGRVVRTIFLLDYIGDPELRRVIQAAQNKCEGFNLFAQWIYFGADAIEDNVRENQLKIIKYNHLVANLVIFHNCHTMTQALKELEAEGLALTPELLGAFSPYRTHHINRFGRYEFRDRQPAPINYGVGFGIGPGPEG
ncbi:Tn3 family transposase [Methylomagnum sp.]